MILNHSAVRCALLRSYRQLRDGGGSERHLITCFQSSLQCLQPSSAAAVLTPPPTHSSFIISFQSVPPAFCDGAAIIYWAAPGPLKWFIAIETWLDSAVRPEIKL